MSALEKGAANERARTGGRGKPQTTYHVCIAHTYSNQPAAAAAAVAAWIYRCSYFIAGGKNIQRNFRETVDGNKIYVRKTNEHSNTQTHRTHTTLKLNHIHTFDGTRNHADKLIHFSESKCAIDIGIHFKIDLCAMNIYSICLCSCVVCTYVYLA